jgi:hypothetical protein
MVVALDMEAVDTEVALDMVVDLDKTVDYRKNVADLG